MNPIPARSQDQCSTTAGEIATLLNGVSLYDWRDGLSYNNGGIWHNIAEVLETYDMDICPGHAAGSDYHHHTIPVCCEWMISVVTFSQSMMSHFL